MTIELSDAQFEALLNRLGDQQAATVRAVSDLRLDLGQRLDDLKLGLGLAHTALGVLEEDLGKAQVALRAQGVSLGEIQTTLTEHTQALEGLTELCSTNFDLVESLNKHIHGESSNITHDAAIRGSRPPQ